MLKVLLGSMREYKLPSLLTVFLAVAEVVFEIIIPLCMSNLIDFGIEEGAMNVVVKSGLWLLFFAAAELLAGVAAAKLAATASAGFAANLRQDMFENVQTFSFSNIDKFSAASIVTRLTTDVTNIQNAYQMIIRMAVRGPIMILFSVIVSFRIHKGIALIFLALIPVLSVCLYLIIAKVNPILAKVFRTYDDLNRIVQENVRGVRVVKTFCSEQFETDKFKEVSGKIYKGFVKAESLIALNSPIMQFFIYGCMIFISWIGAKAIVASGNNIELGLTTGNLMALITYAMQILMSLMMLSMVFVMIVISRAGMVRTTEILMEKADICNPENPVLEVKDGSVRFENVDFKYDLHSENAVIKKADIYIKSGETIGIIGGTGSSKSSFVQLIPRLYDVTGGRVCVGETDVRDYDLEVLRNSVAIVLQKNELFSGTVKENLMWGNPHASDEEIKEACRTACADEFIVKMPEAYEAHVEQGGVNFSGGQKQRLCIARALLKKPKILIFDDSTSAVDTKTEAFILKSLKENIPDTTKIIIAQRVSSVQNADRIIVLENGRIESVGTHEELLKESPIYSEIYKSQMKGDEGNE
ncbi:MAG: ABC transporter ATP-binding protein [Anaerovoracaceae bacterium]